MIGKQLQNWDLGWSHLSLELGPWGLGQKKTVRWEGHC